MSYISPNLTLLISAVKKAANGLNRDFSEIERLQSSVKSHKEFVVAAYGKTERALRAELGKIRPDYAVVTDGSQAKGSCFLVAPIDGLSNFAHGVPHFAVSVAVYENDTVTSAVVYNPANDELFFAEKGKGAYKEGFRNHERLRVSSRKDLSESLVATQVNYKKELGDYLNLHNKIVSATDNVRVLGAVSLDLAYVASGKFDASISLANPLNSFAAGILLVKEAGGYIFDVNQKDVRSENLSEVIDSGNLVAVNAELSKRVFEVLK